MDSMIIFSKYLPQNFSLPPSIIYYMLKKSSLLTYFVAVKLYKTCKYFYMKFKKIFFIPNFYNENDSEYFLPHANYKAPKDVYYWFEDKMRLNNCKNALCSQKIYRCTITKLELLFSTITLKDFLIIARENTIKRFCLIDGYIKNSDGTNFCSIDFILQKLPNVESFTFHNKYIPMTQQQFQNIAKIKLWNKLKLFDIKFFYVSDFFDHFSLLFFIHSNADSIHFVSQFIIDGINSQNNYLTLKASSEALFRSWNGKMETKIYHEEIPLSVLKEKNAKNGKNMIETRQYFFRHKKDENLLLFFIFILRDYYSGDF